MHVRPGLTTNFVSTRREASALPLPDSNVKWPPPGYEVIQDTIAVWNAWYEASPQKLSDAYSGARPGGAYSYQGALNYRPAQFRGGAVGAVARWFWGDPPPVEDHAPKLHVPVGADIATTGADILFGDEPTLKCENPDTQARLDELLDERFWATIIGGAQLCAGLGGVFFRVGWDVTVDDRPLFSKIGPDVAYPVFRWGRLSEVTFCWVLEQRPNGDVLRHLEHHTAGLVEHGLYRGGEDRLGQRIPLTDHDQTAGFADDVDADSRIPTGLPGLDVVYVPNTENRAWRNFPLGEHLGQPDIAGVEPLLDALDEATTSWMRDLRLGKARIIVPQAYLDNLGPGKGATFGMDREIFVKVGALAGNQTSGGQMSLEFIQPAIRNVEHAATVEALMERAFAGAGYSAQTFGLQGDVPITATETNARERRTLRTRASKIRRWRPALAEIAELLLIVDREVFGSGVVAERPDVEFPPYAQDGLETVARSVQLVRDAASMSTFERVALLHPDWDEERIDGEVALINSEQPSLPDPFGQLDAVDPAAGPDPQDPLI